MLGLGEGLLELRKVGDVTGPLVGAPSHRWAVCGGTWGSQAVGLPHCTLCPGHLEPGTLRSREGNPWEATEILKEQRPIPLPSA